MPAPGTVGIVLEQDPEEKKLRLLFEIMKEHKLHNKLMRSEANPVDEYEFNSTGIGDISLPGAGPIQIQPAFSSEVRIESITVMLPVGITSAELQLGQRRIPLYSGAATTLLTKVDFINQGIIINGSDDRFLRWVGVATTGYYVALSGFKLGREAQS